MLHFELSDCFGPKYPVSNHIAHSNALRSLGIVLLDNQSELTGIKDTSAPACHETGWVKFT